MHFFAKLFWSLPINTFHTIQFHFFSETTLISLTLLKKKKKKNLTQRQNSNSNAPSSTPHLQAQALQVIRAILELSNIEVSTNSSSLIWSSIQEAGSNSPISAFRISSQFSTSLLSLKVEVYGYFFFKNYFGF